MIDYRTINAEFIPVEQDKEPEKWLALRTTGVGGSDAGAIALENFKWSSPLVVYFQKKGIQGFKGNKATEWGHILEEPVRQKTREELGYEIITVPGMYRSREHDFMNANLDGLMYIPADRPLSLNGNEISGLVGHEIKTTSGEGFFGDDIPDSYYCQVQHYMAVTGLKYFVLTAFFKNTLTGRHYIVPRDEQFIDVMIEKETDFWENYVLKNVIPEPRGIDAEAEYLKNIPLASGVVLDDGTEELIAQERELDEKIKELSREQSAMKNKIICKMISDGGESPEKVSAVAGRFRISYNAQTRKSVDTAALKKAGLFDKYAKESSFRVLRISEIKAGA